MNFYFPKSRKLKTDLAQIVAFINQIKAIDTTGIEPMSHCVIKAQRLRQDIVTEIVDREQQAKLQQAEPQSTVDGFYRVPKIKE